MNYPFFYGSDGQYQNVTAAQKNQYCKKAKHILKALKRVENGN